MDLTYYRLPSGKQVLVSNISYDPYSIYPFIFHVVQSYPADYVLPRNYPLLNNLRMCHAIDQEPDAEVYSMDTLDILYSYISPAGFQMILGVPVLPDKDTPITVYRKMDESASWMDAAPPLRDIRMEAYINNMMMQPGGAPASRYSIEGVHYLIAKIGGYYEHI